MATNVRVVFDRRKRVEATGKGNVEIIIQLSRLAVKKIIVDTITPEEWENFQHSPLLTKEVENYQKIANAMELLGLKKRKQTSSILCETTLLPQKSVKAQEAKN